MGGSDDKGIARLLDAVLQVTSGLELATVLTHIVEAAATMVEARYGALGVLDEDGQGLAEFVHTGFDEATVARVGRLPEGLGILGLLIEDPRPIRLRELGTHPAATGFPAGHPPMGSFLGVPIRVRDRTFGNLYLTNKQTAEEFTAQDEQLAIGLAGVAGAAIENAWLYAETRRRERWLDALRQVSETILESPDTDTALGDIADCARELVDADIVTISLPMDEGRFVVRAASGPHADRIRGVTYAVAGSVSEAALRSAGPVLIADAATDPRVHQPVVGLREFGPAMFVPLPRRGARSGTITLANRNHAPGFRDVDLHLVETFARQASLVLDREEVRRSLSRLSLLEDRERIGNDLRDRVVHQLFGVVTELQAVADRVRGHDEELTRRLDAAAEAIDDTVVEIRSTVFGVRSPRENH